MGLGLRGEPRRAVAWRVAPICRVSAASLFSRARCVCCRGVDSRHASRITAFVLAGSSQGLLHLVLGYCYCCLISS